MQCTQSSYYRGPNKRLLPPYGPVGQTKEEGRTRSGKVLSQNAGKRISQGHSLPVRSWWRHVGRASAKVLRVELSEPGMQHRMSMAGRRKGARPYMQLPPENFNALTMHMCLFHKRKYKIHFPTSHPQPGNALQLYILGSERSHK